MKVMTIDAYIEQYPENVQAILKEIRNVIKSEATEASEKISWDIPTFHFKENVIHFAAYKNHIGIYPGSEAIIVFAKELKNFKTSKGAIQLPIDKPIPYDLIKKITKFRMETIKKEIQNE